MSCLRIDQIYLYLEEQLPASEIKEFEKHLASCLKCQEAVEERKVLLQASQTLPLLETPPDFTSQVMARIFPQKANFWNWMIAAVACFLSFIVIFTLYFVLSGESLISLLTNLSHFGLDILEKSSVFLIKTAKLIILLGKITIQFISFLTNGMARLMKIINPEIQIILVVLAFILFTSLFWGVKKKLITGEKA